MKFRSFFLLCLMTMYTASIAASTDEERVTLLIQSTEETLTTLKKIQSALQEFQRQEKACIEDSTPDALFELSKRAALLLDLIKQGLFQPYFRKDFIDELEKLAKPYKKKALPSAKMAR